MLRKYIQNIPLAHIFVKFRNRCQYIPYFKSVSINIKTLSVTVYDSNRKFIPKFTKIYLKIMRDINITNDNNNKNAYIQEPMFDLVDDDRQLVSLPCTLFLLLTIIFNVYYVFLQCCFHYFTYFLLFDC